jgi:hypothetical protein
VGPHQKFPDGLALRRGVDIARLMDSVRRLTLRQNINGVKPATFAAATMAEFPQIAMVSCYRKQTA